jgi:hypothetical protein
MPCTCAVVIYHVIVQASLISQSRTLVSHLDAVELDLSTLKPLRPITIFLLTDKLMIVRRPTYTVRGLELCGIQNENPGFESALLKKLEKSALKLERQLKFKDWVNLEDMELFQGSQSTCPELVDALFICC